MKRLEQIITRKLQHQSPRAAASPAKNYSPQRLATDGDITIQDEGQYRAINNPSLQPNHAKTLRRYIKGKERLAMRQSAETQILPSAPPRKLNGSTLKELPALNMSGHGQ